MKRAASPTDVTVTLIWIAVCIAFLVWLLMSFVPSGLVVHVPGDNGRVCDDTVETCPKSPFAGG
jgi:hypothetical protein